ncbi:Acetyl-coenzyme A synthetase chloroplastic/glyoxysomal [Bienertia sinuspersici]
MMQYSTTNHTLLLHSSNSSSSTQLLRPNIRKIRHFGDLGTFYCRFNEKGHLDFNSIRRKMGNLTTENHLRHVESLATLPSGAGKIKHLNAAILGEALASEENDLVVPSDDFSSNALVSSPSKYLEMYKRSVEDPSGFWSDIASEFYWKQKWGEQVCSENLDVRKGTVNIEWFKGGITNICYNCLDRNVEIGNGDKIALYWEGNDIGFDDSLTYSQLLEKVCQLANYLKDVGVKKGDAVIIYLPMLMELPIAMLACARIGAIHSVVFAGFSAESLAQRIVDCKPKVVLTCNAVKRGAKVIGLKDIVDAALVESANNGFSVDVCLTYENQSALKRESTKWTKGRDIWWQDVVPKYRARVMLNGLMQRILYFCFILAEAQESPRVSCIQLEDTWYTLLQHLSMHLTTSPQMFTGVQLTVVGLPVIVMLHMVRCSMELLAPTYPDAGRCWDIVDKYKVSIFYTAPTLVRSLMREGKEITPLPGAWPQKPGSATFPFFGVQPVIVDEKGNEIEGECSGYLCVKHSWPSAFRTLYGDHERYETTYFKPFPGYYFTGDGCSRDKDGYYWLTGRVDDVINVSGHRIGTAEVESALVSHPQCAEAAVVGVEHEVKGQGIYAFVTLVEGVPYSEDLRKSLVMAVRSQIGAFAAPDKIHWAPGLPKTRSGKIMRRILRKIASRQLDELGDTSTLADPAVVDQLIALADK